MQLSDLYVNLPKLRFTFIAMQLALSRCSVICLAYEAFVFFFFCHLLLFIYKWILLLLIFEFLAHRHTLAGNETLDEEQKKSIAELEKNVIKRKAQMYEIEQSLPQKNGLYLKVR